MSRAKHLPPHPELVEGWGAFA